MCESGVQYDKRNGLPIFKMSKLLILASKGEENQYQTSRLQISFSYFNAAF